LLFEFGGGFGEFVDLLEKSLGFIGRLTVSVPCIFELILQFDYSAVVHVIG
jgi:hypothetical protein